MGLDPKKNIDVNVKIYKNVFKTIDKKEKTQDIALKSFQAIQAKNMGMHQRLPKV